VLSVQGSPVDIDDWLRCNDGDREGRVTDVDVDAGLITLAMNNGDIRAVAPEDAHWNFWDSKAPH
jgi:hypothetical protein